MLSRKTRTSLHPNTHKTSTAPSTSDQCSPPSCSSARCTRTRFRRSPPTNPRGTSCYRSSSSSYTKNLPTTSFRRTWPKPNLPNRSLGNQCSPICFSSSTNRTRTPPTRSSSTQKVPLPYRMASQASRSSICKTTLRSGRAKKGRSKRLATRIPLAR